MVPPQKILAMVLVFTFLLMTPASATVVSDNLSGWLIGFLGYGKEDSTPDEYGGSLIERVNFLESENRALKNQMDKLSNKADTLATKEDVENVSKAANASYNLFVYIPKNIATRNYAGQQVRITSESGNQNSTATLRDDGTNYSTTLYFNFSGNCRLNFNVLCNTTAFGVTLPVTISATGQEQLLWKRGGFSEQYSFDFIHQICSSNQAELFFSPGNKLKNGWTVIGTQSNAVWLWNGKTVITTDWENASNYAATYYQQFNNENETDIAYSSGLLSKIELLPVLKSTKARFSNGYGWTSSAFENDPDFHYIIGNDGSASAIPNTSLRACCPAVWIH